MTLMMTPMTLMMTSAQVVETSVNVTNNRPSRDYSHPDDQTTQKICSLFAIGKTTFSCFHCLFLTACVLALIARTTFGFERRLDI